MSALGRTVRGVLERRDAFGRSLERRDASGGAANPWSIPAPGNVAALLSSSGTAVSADAALTQITMYRGVQLLSDLVSGLPVQAVQQLADGTRQPVIDKPDAIVRPFVACSLREGVSQIVTSLVLRGNAYLAAVAWADRYGLEPIEWRILSPDQVQVAFGPDGERQYKVNGRIWTAQMVHLTGFMLPGAVKGVGIIEYVRNAIGLGIALDDVAGEFFRNGVMSTGVIGVDGELDPDNARAIAEQFKQNHSGVRRAHLPIVMGGGAKYTPLSLTPEDAQFIESRQFQAGQIATLLGIPPHLLGIVDKTTSWGTGIEVQGRAFIDYTLRPYIQKLESMFSAWLPKGTYAVLDTDQLTRPDTETRFKNWQMAMGANNGVGFMTVDEIRAAEGMPPLPNGAGERVWTAISMAPVSDPSGVITAAPAAAPANDPNTDQET